MHTRRTFLRGSGGAALAGALAGAGLGGLGPGGAAPALAADRMWPLGAIPPGALNPAGIKVLANAPRIAVPSYRFGVVMRSGISATGGSGTVAMEASAELVGVDLEQLRQIADAAFADFMALLAATGRPVVPASEIAASGGFRKLQSTPVPFVKRPFADARTVVMVSPHALPLVNQHSDAPISDQSPFALGNWRAINQMCVDMQCVVMIPSVVIDFAQLSGSGHSVYGSSARVGVQPGLFLVPLMTQLSAHHARIALAGPGGKVILKDRVSIGQAGQLVQTSSHNNRSEVDWWNAVGRWDANALPGSAPSRAYDYSTYQYQVEPAQFARACLDGAKAMNRIYADAAAANQPG